jgi:hypothetical protein
MDLAAPTIGMDSNAEGGSAAWMVKPAKDFIGSRNNHHKLLFIIHLIPSGRVEIIWTLRR